MSQHRCCCDADVPPYRICVYFAGCYPDGRLAGSATVTDGAGFSGSCSCAATAGSCCVTTPGPGTYTVTQSAAGYPDCVYSVTVPTGQYLTTVGCCMGFAGYTSNFSVQIQLNTCGKPAAGQAFTVTIGTTTVSGTTGALGTAWVCLPWVPAASATLTVSSPPARYKTLSQVIGSTAGAPGATWPSPCTSYGLSAGRPLQYAQLMPQDGYACFCGCDVPVARTLHGTDSLYGVAFTVAYTGTTGLYDGDWEGAEAVDYPGCVDAYGHVVCAPLAGVPVAWTLFGHLLSYGPPPYCPALFTYPCDANGCPTDAPGAARCGYLTDWGLAGGSGPVGSVPDVSACPDSSGGGFSAAYTVVAAGVQGDGVWCPAGTAGVYAVFTE